MREESIFGSSKVIERIQRACPATRSRLLDCWSLPAFSPTMPKNRTGGRWRLIANCLQVPEPNRLSLRSPECRLASR